MPTSSAIDGSGRAARKPFSKAVFGFLRRRGGNGGFTLIEMVLALAILSLLAALGLPFIRPNGGAGDLRFKAFQIVALLREERNAALRSGRITMVSIDSDAGVVGSSRSLAKIVIPPTMSLGVSTGINQTVHFYANGASSGGSLSIRSEERSVRVEINRLTSAVSVSENAR